MPKEGDEVRGPGDKVSKWEKIEAGKDGAFSHKALENGYAYVAGTAGFGFPTTPSAFDRDGQNLYSAFLTKLNPTGSAPLGYRWRFNGAPITNVAATNTTLTLSNVQPSAAGGYSVVVSNSVASVTSVVATLTVGYPAQIVTQPQDQTVLEGDSVTFSVGTTGDPPLFYRWTTNGVIMLNFTAGASSLTSTNVQLFNAGRYQVLITNLFLPTGTRSSNAVLTVLADSDRDHIPDMVSNPMIPPMPMTIRMVIA